MAIKNFIIDNYQWLILVGIGLTALIVAIINLILRRRKQPKFKVYNIRMDPVTKNTHPKSDPDICSTHLSANIINIGDYKPKAQIIFKVKFNCKCKDDKGKRIIVESKKDYSPNLKEETHLSQDAYIHKNAFYCKRAKLIIFAKYNKTSGREVKRRIGSLTYKKNDDI